MHCLLAAGKNCLPGRYELNLKLVGYRSCPARTESGKQFVCVWGGGGARLMADQAMAVWCTFFV